MAKDLEKLLSDCQDRLRGGPPPPPTWRERMSERLRPFQDWMDDHGWMIAFACFLIAAILQTLVAVMKALD